MGTGSTNSVDSLIDGWKRDIEKKKEGIVLEEFKCPVPLGYDKFRELICLSGQSAMLGRHISRTYDIDSLNEPVIRQLYLYFMHFPDCKLNPNAGIYLAGNVGCGKSVLLLSFTHILSVFLARNITYVNAIDLASHIKCLGMNYFRSRPLLIDDMGREETEVNDFGTKIRPVIDLLSLRYETGARTYITSNFKKDSFKNKYGDFTLSRMEESMNYVVLKGGSRRLNNQME